MRSHAAGTSPSARKRRQAACDRSRARRHRARHPHAADRHRGACRMLAASDLGAREREWANAVKSGADHLAALTTLIVDAVEPTPPAWRCGTSRSRRAGSPKPWGNRCRARRKHGHQGRDRYRGRPAGMVIGDPLAPARGAGKSRRQCGEIHPRGGVTCVPLPSPPRADVRLVFAVADSGIGLTPANQKAIPAIRAGEQRSRAAMAARVGLVSSSVSPRPWAAISPSPASRRGHLPSDRWSNKLKASEANPDLASPHRYAAYMR